MLHKDKLIEITQAKPSGTFGSFVGHCPAHDDSNPSFSMQFLEGQLNPLVHCHAGCSQEEVIFALRRLDLWSFSHQEGHFNLDQEKHSLVSEIWNQCQNLQGTVAETYLVNRGLSLPATDIQNLKFHPSLKHNGQNHPALVGKVHHNDKSIESILRIFLTINGKKIDSPDCKKSLGPIAGGCIPLTSNINPKNRIHLCEGVETAIGIYNSIAEDLYVAVSANNLGRLDIVKAMEKSVEIHIWADNDKSKTGIKAARSAQYEYSKLGFETYIHLPIKHPQNSQKSYDFLDQFIEFGPESIKSSLSNHEVEGISPIKSPQYSLPQFMDTYLPPFLWVWTKLNAEKLNVPLEMIAIPLITIIGNLIGRKTHIIPKKNDRSFKVYPNLWGVVIAPLTCPHGLYHFLKDHFKPLFDLVSGQNCYRSRRSII